MILLLLAMTTAAIAGDRENVTFATAVLVLEGATPDVRTEITPGERVRAVLSWPVQPWSWEFAAFPGPKSPRACASRLLLEPLVEPQFRPADGAFRFVAGSHLVLNRRERVRSLELMGGAISDPSGWGAVAGAGLAIGPLSQRPTRSRLALAGRGVFVPDGPRFDVLVDFRFPISHQGWKGMARGDGLPMELPARCQPESMPQQQPDMPEPLYPPDDDDPYMDGPGTCDPVGCGKGQCGEVSDGCGGTMSCGSCEDELLDMLEDLVPKEDEEREE